MHDYNPGHVTSQSIGEDVVFEDVIIHEDPAWANGEPTLTPAEEGFFKREGYLVKRNLVREPEAVEQALDYAWSLVPGGVLDRHDPRTWLDDPQDQWTDADAERVGKLARGNWKIRSRGADGIGTEPFLLTIANNAALVAVVETFFGRPVMPVRRVRGIYLIFPRAGSGTGRYGAHSDYAAAHLSAMVMIDAVPPRSGGFTVWPGSHSRLHPLWDTVHGSGLSEDRREDYRRERDACLREIAPVEFTGEAGDVVFWHPRILHSAGINQSATWERPVVRAIVPCDFQPQGPDYFDDVAFGPGPEVQYWIDTRNFHGDVAPTSDNLWSDWAI